MDEFTPMLIETKNMRSYSANGKIVYKDGSVKTLEHGMSEIPGRAYKRNEDIVSVILPSGIRRIKEAAFSNCTSLESIVIPDSVTSIAGSSFEYCTSLKSIVIPPEVKTICKGAFESCMNLESVTLPDGLEKISDLAFIGCEALKEIHIPDRVITIGENAFTRCENITEIEIPKSVSSIGFGAFSECYALTNVNIHKGEYLFFSRTISIGNAVFRGDAKLTSIYIPKALKSIRANVFGGCDNLENIYYEGSKSDWRKINIDKYGNAKLFGGLFSPVKKAKIHYDCK